MKKSTEREHPPSYKDFGITDPPDLERVWLVGRGKKPFEPLNLEVPEAGQVWTLGWLIPTVLYPWQGDGIQVFVNGRPILPTDALNSLDEIGISGALGCILSDHENNLNIPVIIRDIKKWVINSALQHWLSQADAESYRTIIQPLISSSIYTRRRLIKTRSQDHRDLFLKYHQIGTTREPKTPQDLLESWLRNDGSGKPTINATLGLHPGHYLLKTRVQEDILLDLRDIDTRAFFTAMLREKGGDIRWVDVVTDLSGEEDDSSDEDYELRQWFLIGFRNTQSYKGVKVRICDKKKLNGRPAALVPSKSPPWDLDATVDYNWLSTATLIINRDSELIGEVRPLLNGEPSKAITHIPIVVHNLAALSSSGTLMGEIEFEQWGHVTRLLSDLKQLENAQSEFKSKQDNYDRTRFENVRLNQSLLSLQAQYDEKARELEAFKDLHGIRSRSAGKSVRFGTQQK